ncbi:hypothetical protein RHMOL_Rhmol05G0141700 [Rhododendron molle]|uniref:Uncharacterized protein n=1 Tax=Rhododendron molle TaxID=49168 RepID=A0ACC0NQ43_RHOML|nr:hypothetical protein RHMOL_Rhmol05G0141700 [Rhododendron molle]
MPRLKQTAHRAISSQPEIEEEDDFMAEDEENQSEEALRSRSRKRRRTPQEIAADNRRGWEASMDSRKFKNEWQVDATALPADHVGLPYVIRKGLQFWTEPLAGYNKNSVIEFYKYMQIPEGDWENDPKVKITSRVGGIDIKITPDDIAKALSNDPTLASVPHVPGNFKASFRFLNKVIHFNLYPYGTEHKPTRKSGEILYAFTANDLIVDWAMFIFTQLCDFRDNTLIPANMPFPYMITSLCKEKGVRGEAYEKLEELSPSPFDENSLSQTHVVKDKQVKARDYLTTIPSRKEEQASWIKKLFYQGVALINFQMKEKIERRKIMREQERQRRELAWQTSILEQHHGVKYVPEPVEELEVSDDFAGYASEELDD